MEQSEEYGNTEKYNKEIVQQAFDNWAKGSKNFFDILAPDATWTIMGSGPSARTYHGRLAYTDAANKPLFARLSGPVVPRLIKLWADEDHVIVRWDQDAATRDGESYYNSYAWFFKMKDGKVIEVTDFLDLPAYDAVLARVAPGPPD